MERNQTVPHLNLLVEDYKDELGNEDYAPFVESKPKPGDVLTQVVHKAINSLRSVFSRGNQRAYSH